MANVAGQPYPPGQAQYPEGQYAPPGPPQAYPQPGFSGYAPPGEPPAPTGLPQRPPGAAGGYWGGPGASTVDELVAGATTGQGGDDIDQMIRLAEAGVKPAAEAPAEKKSKKEKVRMFYLDGEISPEERMAKLPRYALVQ